MDQKSIFPLFILCPAITVWALSELPDWHDRSIVSAEFLWYVS
jgi:hypothetical protein